MDPKDPTTFSTMPTYGLPEHSEPDKQPEEDPNQAADMIRQKINSLYEEEPSAKEESAEAKELPSQERSVHQQFMYQLTSSGKSLAEIQTAWHNYYANLPDEEKHRVWQEFYAEHSRTSHYARAQHNQPAAHHHQPTAEPAPTHRPKTEKDKLRTVKQIKEQIVKNVNVR